MMNFLSSNSAYPLAKNGFLPWNRDLKKEAEKLLGKLEKSLNPKLIQEEIIAQSCEQLNSVIKGLNAYQKFFYQREEPDLPVLWSEGSSRLLDYGGKKDSPIIFLVPSLINRSYIFDLSEKSSMAKFLSKKGFRCLLLDWGDPGKDEKDFGLNEYITRLKNAVEKISTKKKPVNLVGYCMGGLLSLALTQNNLEHINSLALIATPWDFHSSDSPKLTENHHFRESFEKILESDDVISGQLVHQLLYLLNPWSVLKKYGKFSSLSPSSEEAKTFVEREYWLHDNVDLSNNVAKECFINWALDNETANNKWYIGGNLIDPAKIDAPSFIAIARHDRIVPPLCSSPLSILMENSTTIHASTGHLGMVTGDKAEKLLWLPLEKWINSL